MCGGKMTEKLVENKFNDGEQNTTSKLGEMIQIIHRFYLDVTQFNQKNLGRCWWL